MGQYYLAVNADKKEYIHAHKMGDGLKLSEISQHDSPVAMAMLNKLAGDWKSDRVYLIGDYADLSNPEEKCHNALKKLLSEFSTVEMYNYVEEHFREVSAECDASDHGYRYIYNHATRQVIDLNKCPVGEVEYVLTGEVDRMIAAPLPLLLAIGNGRGGGDWPKQFDGYEYVGAWCDTSECLEVRKEPFSEEAYEEFQPNFTMRLN